MQPELRDLIRAQRGVLAAAQASRLGLTDHDLRRLVREGTLLRIRRGAYAVRPAWERAHPGERLALRARAVLLDRPTAVAARQCALALSGLPVFAVPVDCVHAYDRVSRSRIRSGLHLLPRPEGLDVVEESGLRRVTIAHAVAQLALGSGRLAALVPLDAALHNGRVALDDVAAQIELLGPAGARRELALRYLSQADAACESVGETRTRLLLTDLGYAVRSQLPIRLASGQVVRPDLVVNGCVIVEFDGLVKYADAGGADALIAEKRREDHLRALGYAVVRLTWSDLAQPERVARLVADALQRAQARPA